MHVCKAEDVKNETVDFTFDVNDEDITVVMDKAEVDELITCLNWYIPNTAFYNCQHVGELLAKLENISKEEDK